MANATGHGGPRTPAKPAQVSGPGKLSKRTDGKPGQKLAAAPGGAYGDREALIQQERTAPMSMTPGTPTAPVPAAPAASVAPQSNPGQAGAPQQDATASPGGYQGGPFGGPSTRPDEPVTHGIDSGPGGGSAVLQAQMNPQPGGPAVAAPTGSMTTLLNQLSATDTSGVLASLYQVARAQNA